MKFVNAIKPAVFFQIDKHHNDEVQELRETVDFAEFSKPNRLSIA